jgi:mono/diheme cytochrome c family protein
MMERAFMGRAMVLTLPFVILTACGGDDASDQAAAPSSAAPSAPAAPAEAPSSDLVALGQQVYSGPGICFSCHGPAGQGTALGPNLTDDTWIWIENPAENLQAKLVQQIRTGTPQPREFPSPMPPMGGASLTEEQLQAVAAYVASL